MNRDQAFQDQGAIRFVLGNCVLSSTFTQNKSWTQDIVLTDSGSKYLEQLKEMDPDLSREAVLLACFLEERRALIEPVENVHSILTSVEQAMRTKTLFLVNNVGREFHDSLVANFPNRTGPLSNAESESVLRPIDQGVYHVGRFLYGPLGVQKLPHQRALLPSTEMPAYFCSDQQCFEVHRIRLETDLDLEINRTIPKLRSLFGWPPQYDHAREEAIRRFFREAQNSEPLFDLLADGLSSDELRVLVGVVYEACSPDERSLMRSTANLKKSSIQEFASTATKAELVQVLLSQPDSQIEAALDRAVFTGRIVLKDFEVRGVQVENRWPSGRRVRAELSKFGWRKRSTSESVARNLMRMVHDIYFVDDLATPEDLAYNIEAPIDADVDRLLTAASRLGDAQEVISRVLLADRRLARETTTRVSIPEDIKLSKAELVDAILWKLGGDVPIRFDAVDHVTQMSSALMDGLVAGAREPEIRGITANLFNSLESAVRQSLIFSTWALTQDHSNSPPGFQFDPDTGTEVFDFIEQRTSTQASYRFNPSGQNSFALLAAGFSRLADALEASALEDRENSGSERDVEQQLAAAPHGKRQRPQVFRAGPTFHSLLPESQRSLLMTLRGMSSALGDSRTVQVRNAAIHADHPFPNTDEFAHSLKRIGEWTNLGLSSGLFPSASEMLREERDSLGRSQTTYISRVGHQVVYEPQWHDARRMPLNARKLIFIPDAVLTAVGALRFGIHSKGNDDAWKDYPHRVG